MILLFIFSPALVGADLDPRVFFDEYDSQLNHPRAISPEVRAKTGQYEFVFVGGFLGDFLSQKVGFVRCSNLPLVFK